MSFKRFTDWKFQRSTDNGERCPDDLLENADIEKLNYWLSRFVAEVRRVDGKPYPPRSISQLLAALQRIMLETNPNASKFVMPTTLIFVTSHKLVTVCIIDFTVKGSGQYVIHHTPTFSVEDEQNLWDTGSIGIATPKALQRAVFFYIRKRFCIRGR